MDGECAADETDRRKTTAKLLCRPDGGVSDPVTTAGRVLDIVLEVWAISAVATLAGSLSAFFHARHMEQAGSG